MVCNDARLAAGDETAYDTHETAATNVRVSEDLSTTELRDALYEETDFLHFVGHVTEAGMVCPDGALDTRTLARTGVSAFFLNGCRSYEQGRALLTAGSVGGIVTVDDVADDVAGRIGHHASLLLDHGVPLYGVLDVLRRTGLPADRYAILGSGTLAFRRAPGGAAATYAFDTDDARADASRWPSSGTPLARTGWARSSPRTTPPSTASSRTAASTAAGYRARNSSGCSRRPRCPCCWTGSSGTRRT
ncbi:hypothetical protein [Halobacterium sp. CBA1126]|uniref:hypothetical protein n=1 Tax=Halobacterium sp. CBA1126 TaxID=2668074 RepID=UPI0012FA3FF1|nr:hypothetical protein [Halobacterium sp. CBA1126]MUV60370.1 hypothetical protein [Halobacterium sp. CBA1126]